MIPTRLFIAVLIAAGAAAQSATATPLVVVNQGQNNECTITPSGSTVFTLSTEGNVLINGSYTSGSCGGSSGSNGNPTFSFNPNPANLTVSPNSLSAIGGNVTPNFVAYFANTCKGSVTASAGCTAAPAPWGTAGTVCTALTNANGQAYCSPSGTVTLPANLSTTTDCTYTFKATQCTNNVTSVDSQTAVVTVIKAGGGGGSTSCTQGDTSGDLPGFGRQCSGTGSNYGGTISWSPTTSTFAQLFGAEYPGSPSQPGKHWSVTLTANQYASFQFSTGTTVAGIQLSPNPSFGATALLSISTQAQGPGYFHTGLCYATNLTMSTKSPTAAFCKLSPNTTYYLNMAMADYSTFVSTCANSSCTAAGAFDPYNN
jgi:hypothetical protein